ncbi:unnamed protein product [Rotaria sp. Silwood2]|nr:unnamed protein product [Rotaria sp. Silwood2]CAF4261866.1 unnamed protein product [Rotaria sp. Silwood2]CAF4351541.1 unnamed protein product [Rotaria sp. Silwood2]CAF4399484.1 unnamed protein product [Rotaria sp. Silwood2]
MNVGLVVEAGGFLLLPASPPGYCSSQIGDHLLYAGNYISLPCPIGTARNTTSFGPCFICPPKTKNNGSSGMNCEVCSSNESLLCLRGTKMEVEWNKLSSFNQANPYPDSPETKEFDDVLLQNVFKFGTLSSHCLIISPLFWATLAIGFSFIVVIIMGILAFYPKQKPHRTFVQKIFTRIDLIGHGELWLGGLVSVVLMILIGFTCKFSISFSNLYPIEIISASTHSSVICDPNLINAKFISALQLLSIHKHDEEEPIFRLLDEQQIVLTTQFVSTEFQCEHVTMQRNMDKGQQTLSSDFNCTTDNESNIVSVSTLLPQHLIVVQFSLTGSSFIGGLRICFNGPSTSQSNGKYTIQMFNFCRFFFTINETLTANSIVNVKMTKVINRTAPLSKNDESIFTGRWLPTLTVNTLADALLFEQRGKYRRYLSNQIVLVVDLTESEFYLENSQEPIARPNEIVFQTVLFSMLCLELFGLLFLIFKLLISPFIPMVLERYFKRTNNDQRRMLTKFILQRMNEAIDEYEMKNKLTRDSI